jgi:hypothetical protein
MIGCLLIYQTCRELFVNYSFLVLVWIWLHACFLYVSRLGLVKLILYHVNSVTFCEARANKHRGRDLHIFIRRYTPT